MGKCFAKNREILYRDILGELALYFKDNLIIMRSFYCILLFTLLCCEFCIAKYNTLFEVKLFSLKLFKIKKKILHVASLYLNLNQPNFATWGPLVQLLADDCLAGQGQKEHSENQAGSWHTWFCLRSLQPTLLYATNL